MTTVSNRLFDTTILNQPATRAARAAKAAKPKARHEPAMPASLWRHTQNEDAAATRHGLVVRTTFGILAALGAGSVSYAAWQLCALLSGDHLHDAVSAFLR